ncbi:serine/threonine protein kinase [Fuerstiella marisgermanici]|nr:serine/threonine-protein kinase [Fuerstiella marisgermanici]
MITSRLVRMEQWKQIERELTNGESVAGVLSLMERRQLLTSLQTKRILKGTTDGLVLGNYKLLYRNASGSFARVYRAATLDDQQTVAVKLLRERWAADPEAVAGFHREARICQRFQHPNIVPILDVGSEGDFHYFTMDFVEGGNLRDFMRIRKSLSPAEAARCTYEICAGLDYALSMGATHRDLKLTNVLMSSTGVAKLVDFGLAGAESPTRVGTSDDVHRALEYASLERGTNAPDNDPRSDLFFAGAIMYELVSGQSAWPRTRDRDERKQLSRYTSTPPLRSILPNVPNCIAAIVDKLMQVGPNDRYQSAAEAMVDLKAALIELGEWTGQEDGGIDIAVGEPQPFELLIVDSVKKRIKALTEYFAKHEFETSFVSHPDVAIERLKGDSPPDGLLVLADHFTDETLSAFPQMQAYGRSKKVPCLAVFPREEEERVNKSIRSTKFGATAFQPATLREIRLHFEEVGAITRSM